jgi:hypothetical protein
MLDNSNILLNHVVPNNYHQLCLIHKDAFLGVSVIGAFWA